MTTYFCDGLTQITVTRGVVRLEFHRLEPALPGDNRELRAAEAFIVAMPLQGFGEAIDILENLRDRLVHDGLLTPSSTDPATAPRRPSPARSPNF